ncbi:MAG: hypothetical protein AAFQ29_10775 [Pseudomonadota bacterium]
MGTAGTGLWLAIRLGLGFSLALRMVIMTPPAASGEYEKIGATGGRYQFTECTRPEAPTLRLDTGKTGNAAILDYNVQVDRMNRHLARVQEYMTCLSAEADRDLQTYYSAVNASLMNRQEAMGAQIDAMRKVLATGPNRPRKRGVPVPGIPALRGAMPQGAVGSTQKQPGTPDQTGGDKASKEETPPTPTPPPSR